MIVQPDVENQSADDITSNNEILWELANSRYGVESSVTLKRLDEHGNLEYKTEFTSTSIIQVINEKFIIIDNKSLWQRVTKLNDDKIYLELAKLNDTKQFQQASEWYQNEEVFDRDWLQPTTQSLQENFHWKVIKINLLNKIINSKYSFLSLMTALTLGLGSFFLFDAKNNLHKENPLLHLFNDWEDIIISIASGLTMSNLSYLNYKIIYLTSKWKYLSFLGISTVIGAWKNYLNLYVSENDFDLTTFAKGTGINVVICILEELIFDKIAQPLIKKIWENLKNKNLFKATGWSSVICLLVFLSSLEGVVSGLFGEQKEINLENVKNALPLALLVTIIENSIYSAYFFYFDLFLSKIKNSIVAPLTNSVKWCWDNITSCFTNSDIIENVNTTNHEAETKLLEEFVENKLNIEEVLKLINANEQAVIPIEADLDDNAREPLLRSDTDRECPFSNGVINGLASIGGGHRDDSSRYTLASVA